MTEEMDSISDGYHTFGELYQHRNSLFIALCRAHPEIPRWRSKLHLDGTGFEGWFVLGLGKEKGKQISYHLPLSMWEETIFAETLDRASEFDGHKSEDVLKRLKDLKF